MAKKKQELSPADQALEAAKGKFQNVMVLGIDNKNNIDISSNNTSYVVLQWLLNRAIFELLIHEKANTEALNNKETNNE